MKRNLGLFVALFLVAAGAEGCPTTDGPGDSGTLTGPGPTGGNALTIVSGTVDCLNDTTVELTMDTTGPAASAEVFSQETANTEPQWAETTNLDSVGNGAWEQTLSSDAATPSDVVQDSTSLFKCTRDGSGNPYHHNASVMTYIFRAYDASGVEFDCVVAGDDPSGLINDSFDRATAGPTNPGIITSDNCRTATFSY